MWARPGVQHAVARPRPGRCRPRRRSANVATSSSARRTARPPRPASPRRRPATAWPAAWWPAPTSAAARAGARCRSAEAGVPGRSRHGQSLSPARVRRPRVGSRAMVQISISGSTPELPLPSYAHPGDAGADLHAAVDLTLAPGERALVPTGHRDGAARGVRRPGAPALRAWRRTHGISIVNAPGHHRRGLPRRGQGLPGQHRPHASRSPCAAATGSPSWWSSASRPPPSWRPRTCRTSVPRRRGLRFDRRVRTAGPSTRKAQHREVRPQVRRPRTTAAATTRSRRRAEDDADRPGRRSALRRLRGRHRGARAASTSAACWSRPSATSRCGSRSTRTPAT